MNLVQLLYANIITAAMGSTAFSVLLYWWWRKDRIFLAFAAYSFGIILTLSAAFLIQWGLDLTPCSYVVHITVISVTLVSFYEVNRLLLGGGFGRFEYFGLAIVIAWIVPWLVLALGWPERLVVFYTKDAWGQVIAFARVEGASFYRSPLLPHLVVVVVGWFAWTLRHLQLLYRARRRTEGKIAFPVVIASIAAPLYDFGIVVGWWRGVYLSFFLFGAAGMTAGLWLIYQMFQHGQVLEDLTQNLERKVDERTLELKSANLHLEEVNALKNDFLAICSHDLKNLLVAVQGYAEMIDLGSGEGTPPGEVGRYAREIRNAAQRMLTLIRDLLDSARLESGRAVLQLRPTWVHEVVSAAFVQHQSEAAQKGIRYSLEMTDGIPELSLDASKLQQAVANLLHNAIKFTPQGGEIRCRVRSLGIGCEVEVSDTGPGIAPEDQEIVFDKFAIARRRREDSTTKLGTGLGLSIAKTFVELHGGTVALHSRPGSGTTFTLRLPGSEALEAGEPT